MPAVRNCVTGRWEKSFRLPVSTRRKENTMTQMMRTEETGNTTILPKTVPEGAIDDYLEQALLAGRPEKGSDWVEQVTLKIPEGWVGDRFTSKSGQELVEVKIPNADRNDKSPWPSFVTDPKRLHKNKFGTGLWMKLPKNAHTTLKRRERVGVDPSGKGIYEDRMSSVPNTELKSMTDAARRSSQKDRRPAERRAQQENNPADRHVQQVSEMAAAQQEDLPDFLREPARTR